MRTIDILIDKLGKVTLSDSLLGMVGEHNNTRLCVRSEDGFFSDADFFRMCFGRYETSALYPVDGVIEYLVPGMVTGSTTKSWQLAGYRFDGQTPSMVKKSEVAAFVLLPSAEPRAEIDPELSGTIEEEIQTLSGLVEDASGLLQQAAAELDQAAERYVEKEEGKSLSTNDYTDADKAVVSGHAEDIKDLQDCCTELRTIKVDKVSGKGLSTNDYTDADKEKTAQSVSKDQVLSVSGYAPYVTMCNATLNYPIVRSGAVTSLIFQVRGKGSIDFEIDADSQIGIGRSDFTGLTNWTDVDLFSGNPNSNLTNIKIMTTGTFDIRVLDDPATVSFVSDAMQTEGCAYVSGLDETRLLAADLIDRLLNRKVDKEEGKSLSTNDYTDADKTVVSGHAGEVQGLQEACAALEAGKLGLPVYDAGRYDADSLTTPGIYATSYAGPQNFPFIDSAAMPFLIVAEAGRMPPTSDGAPDFSEAKTLMQACIGKDGALYCRYKIPEESGSYDDWAWSAWSTKAVSVVNNLTSSSATAALSAAQGKALSEGKADRAWTTLAQATVAEGEEASVIKIALPDAVAECGELMLEAELYVGADAASQWMPTFLLADTEKIYYNCWLAGGGTAGVTAGTKYYFAAHSRVGTEQVLTVFGQASEHIHANSRAAAYTARTNNNYARLHESYPCYLHCEIASGNTFAAGTKIKLTGR